MIQVEKFKGQLEAQWRRLYRVSYAWCHDPHIAMDLTQETIAKALKQRHQLREPQALNRWLLTILANNWRDYCRKHQDLIDIDEVSLTHHETPERTNHNLEVLEHVRVACARLNQDQREVLSLIVLEGLSYADTSQVLGISNGTVMSRLCRARENLRKHLHAMGRETESQLSAKIRRIK